MTIAQNLAFMNDPRRIEAKKRLDKVMKHIQADLKDGSAGYYLTVLPPLLKMLEEAYENLIIVEATIEAEITSRSNR